MLNQLDSHTITVPSTIEQTKIEKLLGRNKKKITWTLPIKA